MPTLKNRIWDFIKTKGAYVGLALVILVVVGFAAWKLHTRPGPAPHEHAHNNYAEKFFITSADFVPDSDSTDAQYVLQITFSQPVDPGQVKNFFEMDPNVSGNFRGGENQLTVQYFPDFPFQNGIKVFWS